MIWYDMLWYDMLCYAMMWHDTMSYVLYNVMAMQYNTMHWKTHQFFFLSVTPWSQGPNFLKGDRFWNSSGARGTVSKRGSWWKLSMTGWHPMTQSYKIHLGVLGKQAPRVSVHLQFVALGWQRGFCLRFVSGSPIFAFHVNFMSM